MNERLSWLLPLFACLLASCEAAAALDADEQWLAQCEQRIQAHYREPKQLKSDGNYSRFKVYASFFVNAEGKVSVLEIDRKVMSASVPPALASGKPKVAPAYVEMSNSENERLAEQATLRAVRQSVPFPMPPHHLTYGLTLKYEPSSAKKFELKGGPAPILP